MTLIRNVNFSSNNIVMNFFRRVYKRLLHIVRRLGTRLHENQPILLRKRPPLLRRHRPPMLQIVLVPNQHYYHVALTVLPRLLEPAGEVFEGVTAGNVVDEQCAGRAAVVGAGDGPEGFLAGRVPDLEFYLLVFY